MLGYRNWKIGEIWRTVTIYEPGALPMEPAMYDHDPSRISMHRSSRFTTVGLLLPLLHTPPAILQSKLKKSGY